VCVGGGGGGKIIGLRVPQVNAAKCKKPHLSQTDKGKEKVASVAGLALPAKGQTNSDHEKKVFKRSPEGRQGDPYKCSSTRKGQKRKRAKS